MDENLETKDENMKNEMTHSSIVQLRPITETQIFHHAKI